MRSQEKSAEALEASLKEIQNWVGSSKVDQKLECQQ